MSRRIVLKVISVLWIAMAALLASGHISSAQQEQALPALVLQVLQGQLTIYNQPGQSVVQSVPVNGRVLSGGVTQQVNNRNWIQVTAGDVTGWASPDSQALLIVDPSRISPGMELGATFQPTTSDLILYQSPDFKSGTVGGAKMNTQLSVTDGPALTSLFTWWKVKTADGIEGWIPDTGTGIQVIQPLIVYNYTVCDGFNLKAYGVPGWDAIVKAFPTLIPATEKIVCLASSNFKGDKSPTVFVLSRKQGTIQTDTQDTLRIFHSDAQGGWTKLYEFSTDTFVKTERLSMHDLTGDGKPSLLWMTRNDGTGAVLNVKVLRYHPVAGVQPIMSIDGLYQGSLSIGNGGITLFTPDYKADEPNCCHAGLQRMSFVWQNNEFVQLNSDVIANPYWLQGIPKQ